MNWKYLPYWLRGGLVTIFLSFIISSLTALFFKLTFSLSFLIVGAIVVLTICVGGEKCSTNLQWFLMIVISLISYFIIGALIGWVYGKMKSKISK